MKDTIVSSEQSTDNWVQESQLSPDDLDAVIGGLVSNVGVGTCGSTYISCGSTYTAPEQPAPTQPVPTGPVAT
ncbi:hypothetical protein LXT21_12770 [Myxococcus sp. K38C18041901]|uniref:hypothetical protein n=1 Tax=Myxococcus guangdongensis TaxID=2906760 RepID=UPI0020A7BE75|nr:hypothetical protein [Myxococcus guangdongensis]MCP3059652.1 hypothetical protein [Myxococcus guangdongensis]